MAAKQRILYCLFIVALPLAGFLGWKLGATATTEKLTGGKPCIREITPSYQFIKPLLICDSLDDVQSSAYLPLRSKLETYVQEQKEAGNVTDAGIYYRNLHTGEWIGVNENAQFHPASLLKVPNMISILREEDLGKEILSQTYTANDKTLPPADQLIPPAHTIQNGQTYTVDELLRYLIMYSDNRANHALELLGNTEILTSVFTDFEVPLGKNTEEFTLSPRYYTRFFRTLYSATYLSHSLSEKALRYLEASDFSEGLKAGVPEDIKVAHKFGNYSERAADGRVIQEIHDCGIVYGTNGDYHLCVMTRGDDIKELESVVAGVSKIVYSFSP